MWSTVLEPLSAAREIIAIDLPGHGDTPAESDSGTFDGLVCSVKRYIEDAGLRGVDVVGSSMGARIVLELARRGLVGNVIALDPGGFWRGSRQPLPRLPHVQEAKALPTQLSAGAHSLAARREGITRGLDPLSRSPDALDHACAIRWDRLPPEEQARAGWRSGEFA